ncbi:MAG: SsrA-binding protein SmpB [Acidobacteriota bacterium]
MAAHKKKKGEAAIRIQNRRARYEYHILETVEAGISLLGTEVKSVRAGKVQLRDSYVDFVRGEAFLVAAHISPYSHGNRENHDPERRRKLLLHRREIEKYFGRVQQKGFAMVPLSMYVSGNRIKVELALAQGKKLHDKRASEREREMQREVAETLNRRDW